MSGLLTIIGRFLLGRRFIPEGKRASFLRENPCLVDVPDRTVIGMLEHDGVGSVHHGHGTREAGREAYIHQVHREGIYHPGYTHQGT